ncbi:hypothetical protein [Klebsiella variicola]|uniref:hypothetical protein n=1 Tax=Klebsiella variicola TaxID=244366 RepID=UPI00292976ED|nr:hypothetical protein [Klebsiella variicola]MDV0346673.1 hypothetical protein [Klebsiella variicola]MDV0415586.1 hypothetical protein [Klebsiella variicola]
MNYQNLLNPIIKAHPITLLGQQIFIRRLTQEELWDYEADLQALEKSDDNARQMARRRLSTMPAHCVKRHWRGRMQPYKPFRRRRRSARRRLRWMSIMPNRQR